VTAAAEVHDHTDRGRHTQTDRHTDRQTDTQTDTQTYRHTDRQTDRHEDRHADWRHLVNTIIPVKAAAGAVVVHDHTDRGR